MADMEETPRSFFFHSPPESPVKEPAPSNNPFAQFTDTVSSIANKALASDARNASRTKNLPPRPASSQSRHHRRKPRNSDEDTFSLRPPGRLTIFPTHSQPNVTTSSAHASTEPRRRRPGSSLFATASEVFLPRTRLKSSKSKLRPVQDDDSPPDEVLDISPAQQLKLEQQRQLESTPEQSNGLDDTPPIIHAPQPTRPNLPAPPIVIDGVDTPPSPTSPHLVPIPAQDRHSDASTRPSSVSQPRSTFEGPQVRPVPPFPSSYGNILNSIVHAAPLPRYIVSNNTISHLLPRSRSWKSRLVCLSSFQLSKTSSASFIHTFKSTNPSNDDVELDRLEIGEDSVVFISDEDLGGRRHVLRVGGHDRGPNAKTARTQSGAVPTIVMWFLHVENEVEMHRWVGIVKTMITSRSSDAVGLGIGIDPTPRVNGLAPSMLPPITPISPLDMPALKGEEQVSMIQLPDSRSETDVRTSRRDSTLLKLKGLFSSSTSLNNASKEKPASLRREASADTLTAAPQRQTLRLSFRGPPRAKPLDPLLSRLTTHFEDNWESTGSAAPASAKSDHPAPLEQSLHQAEGSHSNDDTHVEEATDETISIPQEVLNNAHPYLRVDPILPPSPQPPPEEVGPLPISEPIDIPIEIPRHSAEASSVSSSPPAGSKRTSRIRFSAMLPELSAPPTGPLPPPPPPTPATAPLPEREGSRRDSAGSHTMAKYSKRISTGSFASAHSARGAGSSQRHSSLFSKGQGPSSSNRISMPPPPKPVPTFALPPVPRPGSADAIAHISASPPGPPPSGLPPVPPSGPPPPIPKRSSKRESGLPTNLQFPLDNLPPISLPPLGPLPPVPASAPANLQSDRTGHRLSKSQLHPSRISNPFGQSLMNWSEEESVATTPEYTRDNFLEVNTPVSQLSPRQSTADDFPSPLQVNDGQIIMTNNATRPQSTFFSPTMMAPPSPLDPPLSAVSIRSSTSVL